MNADHYYYFPAINASQTFYNATTMVQFDKADPNSRKVKTNLLRLTCHPEDKRMIIGDTFMRVANELVLELNLKLEEVYLAQGKVEMSEAFLDFGGFFPPTAYKIV